MAHQFMINVKIMNSCRNWGAQLKSLTKNTYKKERFLVIKCIQHMCNLFAELCLKGINNDVS
jgi:hypothetical protein